MSVSRRLILSVGVLMILSVGVVGWQVMIIRQMQEFTEGLNRVGFKAASLLLDMERAAFGVETNTLKSLTIADPAIRGPFDLILNDSIRAFDARFKELENVLGPDSAPEEIALLSTAWIDYKTQLEIARQTPPTQSLDELPLDVETALKKLQERTNSSRDAIITSIGQQISHNEAIGRQAQQIAYGAAGLFVLLGGIVTFLTVRAINKPLRELTRTTRKIANGEFSYRVPVKGPSEFKELATDFNAMSGKLEELDQMKKEFVAHVSHELKAPLAAIRQTLAVTLEQVPGPINDGQRRLLELSRKSAERLSAMVSNLLDVSRLEAGTMEYDMRPNNMMNIVKQTVEEFSLKASERYITIQIDSTLTDIPVVCDGDRMIQVVGNLIDNALKFSPENSTIRVRVVHNVSATIPTVKVAIADRGNGVPDAHKEKVFLKFHQLNGGGKRTAGQGVGLGLAICKTIVDAHRGRIWVEDNPEGGSIFSLEMRAAPVKEELKETVNR
jgi:two-component system sensor histidine kinase GlrK